MKRFTVGLVISVVLGSTKAALASWGLASQPFPIQTAYSNGFKCGILQAQDVSRQRGQKHLATVAEAVLPCRIVDDNVRAIAAGMEFAFWGEEDEHLVALLEACGKQNK